MITHNFTPLDLLSIPVWIVSPATEELLFANAVARKLSQNQSFNQMRNNIYSVGAQQTLTQYLTDLYHRHDIVELLTVWRDGEKIPLSCRLSLNHLADIGEVIVFEGMELPATQGLKASRSANYQRKKQGFYARFFQTNSAPMLLIDPARDGLIVDANLAALNFYGYDHENMCQRHTWEINMLGRDVLPVMQEIALLPGGQIGRAHV